MKLLRCYPWNLALLLPALLLQPAFAAETNSAVTKHPLWKVEGQSNVVYLLGSVHALKPEHYPLAAPLESAFSNSQIAAFEVDVGKLESMESQLKLVTASQLPEGETLKGQLSPALYAKFAEQMKGTGLPLEAFDTFKPALAAAAMLVFELQRLGFDPQNGVDQHFYEKAQQTGKQVVGLETVDFQIGMLTGLTKEEGEMFMKSTLEDLNKVKEMFGDLLKAWQTGDETKLASFMNDGMKDSPALFKKLLTDRNERWVPKIEEFLRGDKRTVVIVGAGHLVGKDSVVELLRKKGLKVTQQ